MINQKDQLIDKLVQNNNANQENNLKHIKKKANVNKQTPITPTSNNLKKPHAQTVDIGSENFQIPIKEGVQDFVDADGVQATTNEASWKIVNRSRKHRKNASFVGTNASIEFPTCPKETHKWLFVSRLGKDVKAEDVQGFLTSKATGNFIVEKLTPRVPDGGYSSFKVGVPQIAETTVISPEFWPSNIFVNRFYFKRVTNNKNSTNFQPSSSVVTNR